MNDVNHYAQAPQTSEGIYRNNNVIEPGIIKYLEDESDLRPFFVHKTIKGALSKTYIVEREEGIAVRITGNSEVPRAEDVRRQFTVSLHRNATGYKFTEDDKIINGDDPGWEQRKFDAMLRRLKKREDKDIMDLFFAAAETITNIPSGDNFDVDAITDTVSDMIDNARSNTQGYMTLEPDVIIMPYAMFIELQRDPKFKFVPEIYQNLLINSTLDGSSNRGILYGDTGQIVAGLRIITVNELQNTAIVIDSQKDAFWLCEGDAPRLKAYEDPEHEAYVVDVRHDEAPVCIYPECVGAIKKTN
jgi:hypothetical protein